MSKNWIVSELYSFISNPAGGIGQNLHDNLDASIGQFELGNKSEMEAQNRNILLFELALPYYYKFPELFKVNCRASS